MNNIDARINDFKEKINSLEIVRRIKGIKNIRIIVVIFIIAIALIIYSNVSTQSTASSPVTSMTDEEIRLCDILSNLDGVGEVMSMISVRDGEIVGVLIIAQGGENPLTRLRIIEASAAALGVDKSIVSVYTMS